jgi:hypothetical protein
MIYLGLFFAGAAYVLNGLSFLGVVDARSTSPLNTLVGLFFLAITYQLVWPLRDFTSPENADVLLLAAGELLFAITFLYFGVASFTGLSAINLGWFCGWAALVSAAMTAVQVIWFGDVKSAALWFVWTVVFCALFAVLAFTLERLTRPTGYLIIAVGFSTCFFPGGLLLLRSWEFVPPGVVWAVQVSAIALFLLLSVRSPRIGAEPKPRPLPAVD